jgi:hypothetical protein
MTSPPNHNPASGRVFATLGAILEDAREGRLAEGWLCPRKVDQP